MAPEPRSSPLDTNTAKALFCAGCGQIVRVRRQIDSGTGFAESSADRGAVETMTDRHLFMTRTEVHCTNCAGHLDVFEDGPAPTGLRYCTMYILKFDKNAYSGDLPLQQ
jgi:peptide-methionine (R)-S-oxide reductase